MPYFKDSAGGLHFLDHDQFIHLLPADCVPISEAEAAEMQQPLPLSLEEAKAAKNAEINLAREAANASTFQHDGHSFAADRLSRIDDLAGVVGYVGLYGVLPPDFPGFWKTADNVHYPIPDLAAFRAFYASMVAAGAANFAHSETLKAQVSAATTIEDVAAIEW